MMVSSSNFLRLWNTIGLINSQVTVALIIHCYSSVGFPHAIQCKNSLYEALNYGEFRTFPVSPNSLSKEEIMLC